MVAFRNVVMGTTLTNWWDNGDYAIAFSRGNKGFIVINAGTSDINVNLQTGLSQGTYCDVISGNYDNGRCTGNEVHVGGDGHAHFHISSGSDDPVVAIHIGKNKKLSLSASFHLLHVYSIMHQMSDRSIYTKETKNGNDNYPVCMCEGLLT